MNDILIKFSFNLPGVFRQVLYIGIDAMFNFIFQVTKPLIKDLGIHITDDVLNHGNVLSKDHGQNHH